ncbi:PREDICTED: potassium channel subfamily K member 6-like [Calidris pugnax]|uniref:potassium channel subfamily K member 6-like n=1 Tax=Calidris pugnax TaxID=198806 RepID=UPI00071DE63C|nr:PREDICTED: potassium channel subfamily K member 6-like [Calidris pugnax]
MGRGAVLAAVAYAGLVLLGALGLQALEGTAPPATPHRDTGTPNASRWDLATALLFVTTLLTTVAFCMVYSVVGVPITMLMLTATVRRLTGPLVNRPRLYLQAQWGYSRCGAARVHFVFLVGVTLGVLVLLPAAGFYVLEGSWTYLDAVYFCVISLCTIGLGDLVPAEQPGQPLRQLYQVALAVYLLLGLTGVLLLAQTFHRLAELHGVTGGIFSADEGAEESAGLLEGMKDGEKPARGGASVNG